MRKDTLFKLLALPLISLTTMTLVAQERNIRNSLRNNIRPIRGANAAESAAGNSASANIADGDKTAPAFNWDAAPADIVLQAYGEQLDKTILKDPGIPNATITLKSREGQKLSKRDYLDAIEVVLEMNGIHLEPYGEKFIRAIPRAKARKDGIPIIMNQETQLNDGGRVASMMIQFKNIGYEEAQKTLDAFKSDTGILIAIERTNSILATDTEQNINRMLEIARSIDVASPVLENVFVRQIKHATAADIKQSLEAIVQESQKEQERDGKGANNRNQPDPRNNNNAGNNRLLGRPGANNNQQPQQPVSNASMVMNISDADRGMIRGKVLILSDERSNKLIIVTQKANMDFFDSVIEQLDVETTPDTVVKVYRLKYADATEVSDMINDLIGNSSNSKSSNPNQNARNGNNSNLTRGNVNNNNRQTQPNRNNSANQRGGEAKAGELSKDNTTVLADKRINGLVVMTQKELVSTIESIIESMDVKLSQVLIETVIIEVSLGDDLQTGVDWVQSGRRTGQATDPQGRPLFRAQRTLTDAKGGVFTEKLNYAVPEGYSNVSKTVTDDGFLEETISASADAILTTVSGGFFTGTPGYSQMLGGGAKGGAAAANIASGIITNVFNNGLSYIFKSDKLNLAAIIQASKTDTRTKYLASPVIMTVDNKEAIVEATETIKFYSGSTASTGSYSSQSSYNYTDKDIGIKIKTTPKINPNGTVMLKVEEEYSQIGAGQEVLVSGNNGAASKERVDTPVSRKMSADVLLENMQTVVLGGLTQTQTVEKESGIPILKDIPFIGKWLFGSVSKSESRKELLVFMTPYVLDDGAEAQAEAMRRKNSLSDTRAWNDHGWSLSELADPVSARERLRRLKDEWAKQDEDRKAKLAIEEEKIKRVKALAQMSKEERDFWLEIYKADMEDDDRDRFEEETQKQMSQEELRKMAEAIRKRKLAESQQVIEAADAAAHQENERGRLEAEATTTETPSTEAETPESEAVTEATQQ